MKQVLVTFADKPTAEYPLAVVLIDDNGKRSQESLVRSVRDGRLFGNGMCFAMMYAAAPGDRSYPVNPEIDPRLTEAA